ncbi:MAG: hypothetical protein J6V82_04070, partial [Clostridia bacterium]|nr:hypothetical protein [Clostridia bacterium]
MKRNVAFLLLLLLCFALLLSCTAKPQTTTLPTTSSLSSSSSASSSSASSSSSSTTSTTTTTSVSDKMQELYDVVWNTETSVSPTFVSFAPLSEEQSDEKTVAISPTADDLRVIADRYNTGCRGEESFHKVKAGDTVGGLVIGENVNGFGFSMHHSANAALSEGGTFVFENLDFTDQRFIVIAGLKTPNTPLKLVFNNCRLGLVTTARDGSVPVTFEFNDCTLTMFDGSNATFRRCLFTDSYYYDGMNPFQNVFVYDSAILDKAPVNYDKEMHTDGVQIYGYQGLEAKNLHFDNLRVELPIVYYTDSYALGNT